SRYTYNPSLHDALPISSILLSRKFRCTSFCNGLTNSIDLIKFPRTLRLSRLSKLAKGVPSIIMLSRKFKLFRLINSSNPLMSVRSEEHTSELQSRFDLV